MLYAALHAELTSKDLRHSPLDNLLHTAHNAMTGLESMRALAGAGANTRDNPQRITDYEPTAADVGGLFDDRRRAVKAHGSAAVLASTSANAAGSSPLPSSQAKQRA